MAQAPEVWPQPTPPALAPVVLSLLRGEIVIDLPAGTPPEVVERRLTQLTDLLHAAGEADACRVRAEGEASAARRAAATEHLRVELQGEQLRGELRAACERRDDERSASRRRYIGIAAIVLAAGIAASAVVGVLAYAERELSACRRER